KPSAHGARERAGGLRTPAAARVHRSLHAGAGSGRSLPMTVLRSLSGAWLGVHAPGDPRAMLVWLLDRGFRGVVPGPGPRAVPWRAVAAARESLPVTFAAVRAGGPTTPLRSRPE